MYGFVTDKRMNCVSDVQAACMCTQLCWKQDPTNTHWIQYTQIHKVQQYFKKMSSLILHSWVILIVTVIYTVSTMAFGLSLSSCYSHVSLGLPANKWPNIKLLTCSSSSLSHVVCNGSYQSHQSASNTPRSPLSLPPTLLLWACVANRAQLLADGFLMVSFGIELMDGNTSCSQPSNSWQL